MPRLILLFLFLFAADNIVWGAPPEEPAIYYLGNPVPTALLRDLSTDRPDVTESPYTVDAGHFQIEASFFDYSRERSGGERIETWTLGSMNLKAGLWRNMDVQFIFNVFTEERTRTGGSTVQRSGFSDLTVRWKTNLWGDDGGRTAFALMPYLKVPTGTRLSNDRVEGGLIAPFSLVLTDWLTMGAMAEADLVYDDELRRHTWEWLHSITFSVALGERLSTFFEYAGVAGSRQDFDYRATFNTGVVLAVNDNVALDAGVRIGVTDAGEDFGVFSGFSVRF